MFCEAIILICAVYCALMDSLVIAHLSKDKKLAKVMAATTLPLLQPKKRLYLELVTAIMGQQLSTKVAMVLQQRFFALFAEKMPTPQHVLDLDFEVLKGIGLSNVKTIYIRNVCSFFIEQKLTDKRIYALEDDAIIALLTQIKGVGKWTVQMLLMFSLCRNDIFLEDDFGIQKAMSTIYKIDMTDKKAMKVAMGNISGKWAPYRSYACRYLWRSLDNQ